jgi:asparagine synthase (glutamine-hydrolysing)
MGAIFGWLGREQPLSLQLAHRRLLHRGATIYQAELSPTCSLVKIGDGPRDDIASHGGITVALDGRIYEAAGVPATASRSDARWALDLYLEHGARAFDLINGDYALAIWDERERRFTLARDFCGAQPMYFTRLADGAMLFASEYKVLLAAQECDVTLDRDMIQRLQTHKHLPSERTLFKAIRAVAPGTAIAFSATGQDLGAVAMRQPSGAIRDGDVGAAEKRVGESFLSAMKLRVDSGRRVGVALSGGIDSIGVAFACRKFLGDRPLHTYTVGRDAHDPEVRTAAIASERLGAFHHPVYVSPQRMAQQLPTVVWHLENPIARSETVQFFELGLKAAGQVDMLISGVAADGLYAGMPRHKLLWLYGLAPPIRSALLEFYALTQCGRPPQTVLGRAIDYAYFKGKLPPVPGVVGAQLDQSLPRIPQLSKEFLNDFLRQSFQEAVSQWLPKLERTLGASGVGFTSPFLDRNMIETAFSVSSALKIRRGKEKFILRRALRSLVSAELLDVPKFPMRMAYDAEFADHLDALAARYLDRDRVRARGLFDSGSIAALQSYRAGGRYHAEAAMRVWTAIVTEIWAETFVDRRGEPLPNTSPSPLDRPAAA